MMLLALKEEGGAVSRRMCVASRGQKRQGNRFPSKPLEGIQCCLCYFKLLNL